MRIRRFFACNIPLHGVYCVYSVRQPKGDRTMQYILDHDYHIHTQLSSCSDDPEQTTLRLLEHAKKHGFTDICVTDHFWDETVPGASDWYAPQDYPHIKKSLPLPQADGIRFRFGCETDMDKHFTIGISDKVLKELDFIIIPTTHMHMDGFTIPAGIGADEDGVKRRAELYLKRWDALLNADLPFEKIGIAHITCGLICRSAYRKVLARVSDAEFREMFTRTAAKGCGVELNFNALNKDADELEENLRVYRIAKDCGCKFYFGSDAHHPDSLDIAGQNFTCIRDLLELTENDKFRIGE